MTDDSGGVEVRVEVRGSERWFGFHFCPSDHGMPSTVEVLCVPGICAYVRCSLHVENRQTKFCLLVYIQLYLNDGYVVCVFPIPYPSNPPYSRLNNMP